MPVVEITRLGVYVIVSYCTCCVPVDHAGLSARPKSQWALTLSLCRGTTYAVFSGYALRTMFTRMIHEEPLGRYI